MATRVTKKEMLKEMQTIESQIEGEPRYYRNKTVADFKYITNETMAGVLEELKQRLAAQEQELEKKAQKAKANQCRNKMDKFICATEYTERKKGFAKRVFKTLSAAGIKAALINGRYIVVGDTAFVFHHNKSSEGNYYTASEVPVASFNDALKKGTLRKLVSGKE